MTATTELQIIHRYLKTHHPELINGVDLTTGEGVVQVFCRLDEKMAGMAKKVTVAKPAAKHDAKHDAKEDEDAGKD